MSSRSCRVSLTAWKSIPPVIVNYVKQVRSLQATVIALTVSFEDAPRIRSKDRVRVDELEDGFWHVTVHFAFVEIPVCTENFKLGRSGGEVRQGWHVI